MNKRDVKLDLLRVICIFAVIIMHVIGNTVNTFGLTGKEGNIYFIIQNLCYFSIPIFIMISGVVFLNRDIEVKDIFKKYILKIFLALVFFGFCYSLLEIYFNTKTLTINDFFISLKNIITGNLWAHMWYLYLVIALYLVTPIIRVIVKYSSDNLIKYFLTLLFIFNILFIDLSKLLNINIAFYICISSSYLFYYLYGYYLYNKEISNNFKAVSYLLGVVSTLVIIYLAKNNIGTHFMNYFSTLIFLHVNSIFIFFTKFKYKLSNGFSYVISSISKCSLGIYITHQIYINIIYKFLKFDLILKLPYFGLCLYTLFIFIISYLVVYLLKKIKFVNKYLL